jgi:hypothetical protein
LKQQLVSKYSGKHSKGLFFQDDAAPHQKFGDHLEVQKHLIYSSDLVLAYYRHFPNLKGRKFPITEEATLAADERFAVQPQLFLDGSKKLDQ